MAYRGDTDPLKAQETALASELSALRRREKDVARALDDTRTELRKGRTLPVLEDVRIASPCSASWEEMTGDARVRFCGKCAKSVYNLSEMTREEAETLLAQSEGRMCVRLYKRADGTVLTADCPVGVKKKRVRRVVAVAAATFGGGTLAAMALAPMTMMGARQGTAVTGKIAQQGEAQMMMGDVAVPEETVATPASPPVPTAPQRPSRALTPQPPLP